MTLADSCVALEEAGFIFWNKSSEYTELHDGKWMLVVAIYFAPTQPRAITCKVYGHDNIMGFMTSEHIKEIFRMNDRNVSKAVDEWGLHSVLEFCA